MQKMVIIGNIMSPKNRKRQRERQTTLRMLTLITQFGINMLVPVFLCFFVGYYLDKKIGTSYLMIIFFFIGALAGFRNIYIFARRMIKDDEEKDVEESRDSKESKE